MVYNRNKNLKMFYSITEVAELFEVNPSLLRYWEKEFPQIRPQKTVKGVRQYTEEDINKIGLVHHLVKDLGLTLAGARQRMRENALAEDHSFTVIQQLHEIREELVSMKKEVERMERLSKRN